MPINKQQLKDKSQRIRQVKLHYKLSGYLKLTSIMDGNILSHEVDISALFATLFVIYLHNSGMTILYNGEFIFW